VIKERVAGIITSLFGVKKVPAGKPPVTEAGMIFVSINKARNTTVVKCSVKSFSEFVRGEAQKVGSAVTELPDGSLQVELPGFVFASLQRWPEGARKYVTFGAGASGMFGHHPGSEAVVPTQTGRAVVLPSPFSVDRSSETVVQPVVTREGEIPIGRPWDNKQQEVTTVTMGPKSTAGSPFSPGVEELQDPIPPLPEGVIATTRPSPSPWSAERKGQS
jgi:hypothetical protein